MTLHSSLIPGDSRGDRVGCRKYDGQLHCAVACLRHSRRAGRHGLQGDQYSEQHARPSRPLEYLGKASARLDDVVNLVPARLSALLLLIAGSLCRLPIRRGWQTMLRDQSLTASPNAGWTMSAMAGLLGSRLEKVGHYCLGQEMPEPAADDISKAVRIGERAVALALFLALVLLAARHAILGLI